MTTPKSPFYIVENFLTPKQCEAIINRLDFFDPDEDREGNPIKMVRYNEWAENLIYNKFITMIPTIESYYEFAHKGTEQITFEFYAEGTKSEPLCENSSWLRNNWVRTRNRDLTAVIFLSEYQDQIPFDDDFEVYGGKLEFIQHHFGFNPQRGTVVIFPSGPHFINAISKIEAGDLLIAKFHVIATDPYLYDPSKFPGDFSSWFAGQY